MTGRIHFDSPRENPREPAQTPVLSTWRHARPGLIDTWSHPPECRVPLETPSHRDQAHRLRSEASVEHVFAHIYADGCFFYRLSNRGKSETFTALARVPEWKAADHT